MQVDIFVVAQIVGLTTGAFLLAAGVGKWLHRQMQEQNKVLWKRIDEQRDDIGGLNKELGGYKLYVSERYATVQALEGMRKDMDERFVRVESLVRQEAAATNSKIDRLTGMLMKHAPVAE